MLALPRGKQRRSILEADARLNIWHGSVRSGKTVGSIIRWLDFIENGPPGELLMVGKTERTLKRNILDPIAEMLDEDEFRLLSGKGEAMILGRRVYLAGANDERSEGKIRGLTLVGAYGDELTLWPESFFTMLLSRLSVSGARFFGTTNPDSPFHWLKKNYLDRAEELNLRHWSFGLDDNPNLDPAYVESLKREYTGLWYKRFILGQWVLAEGVVWDMFDPERHIVDVVPPISRYWVAIDYGNQNATVFLLFGLAEDGTLHVIDEWYHSGREGRQKAPSEYSREFRRWIARHNVVAERVFVDPAAQGFISQLYHDGVRKVTFADNAVNEGIGFVASMFTHDLLKIHRRCKHTIEGVASYMWDEAASKRGEEKPFKRDDDCSDCLRYGVYSQRRIWRGKFATLAA